MTSRRPTALMNNSGKVSALPRVRNFAYASAILTLFLTLDDALLLHEVFGKIIEGGDLIIFSFYVIYTIVYLYLYFDIISSNNTTLLLLSLLMFSLSIAIDALPFLQHLGAAIEDIPKFIGICCWSGLHILLIAQNAITIHDKTRDSY